MQAHRAKFNGATGNGRTSVTPLTLNNRRIENRLGGNRVVTTIAPSQHFGRSFNTNHVTRLWQKLNGVVTKRFRAGHRLVGLLLTDPPF